jgi:flagellar assembly protein FliH
MMIMSDPLSNKNQSLGATRWELATLKENKQDLSKNPLIAKLAQELVDSKEKAKEEGFLSGFEEGKRVGHQDGLVQGQQQIQVTIEHLSEIAFNLQKLYAFSRDHIAQEVLELSIALAKSITLRSIEKQPDIIFDVVDKALEQIPILQLPAKLLLNPLDAELIEANQGRSLKDSGWKIVHDASISRGGCRLETGSNDVDATVEKRIEKLMATLGVEPNPLEGSSV